MTLLFQQMHCSMIWMSTGFGYEPAEIPLMGKKTFEADASLRSLIAETCREVNPEIGVFEGRVVSGGPVYFRWRCEGQTGSECLHHTAQRWKAQRLRRQHG